EQVTGLLMAAALFFIFDPIKPKTMLLIAIYAVVISYIIGQLNHPAITAEAKLKTFNWIPFYFQFNRITQIRELLETIWLSLALSFLVISYRPKKFKMALFTGLISIGIISFIIEWQQQSLQRSSPDITDTIVAMGVWVLPFLHPGINKMRLQTTSNHATP
ncbi:MAG: hypothetical protein R3240_07840, partial [Gammaproteobacteria bacterium]|nr:hypothetical protein [Gammaproteobacteria bacterium]